MGKPPRPQQNNKDDGENIFALAGGNRRTESQDINVGQQRNPSSHQLKSREKSESALANAGRKVISAQGSQGNLRAGQPKNYIKENLNKVVFNQKKSEKQIVPEPSA